MSHGAMWSYFQNEASEIFSGGETRINALVRLARAECRNGRLLNIGAGTGYLEYQAKREGFQVASLDPDEKTCARLTAQGIEARIGLIEALPFQACTFDVVTATEVLEHLVPASMNAGLAQIARVLKDRGRFIGTVPHRENLVESMVVCPDCKKIFHKRGHEQSFTVDSLRSELTKHFRVKTCKPVVFPPWNILNWKGKVEAYVRLGLSSLGSHGSNANILFVCSKAGQ